MQHSTLRDVRGHDESSEPSARPAPRFARLARVDRLRGPAGEGHLLLRWRTQKRQCGAIHDAPARCPRRTVELRCVNTRLGYGSHGQRPCEYRGHELLEQYAPVFADGHSIDNVERGARRRPGATSGRDASHRERIHPGPA